MSWFQAAGNFLNSAQGQAGMALGGKIFSAWSANESFKQQKHFAEYMSGSEVQRRMLDLQNAGLNPILAARDGGASSPSISGALPQGDFNDAINSVQSAVQRAKERELIDMQLEKLAVDTEVSKESAANLAASRDKTVQESLGQVIDNEAKTANLKILAEDLNLRRQQVQALENSARSDKFRQVREGLEADLYRKYPWLLNVEKGADIVDSASRIINPAAVVGDVLGKKAPRYERRPNTYNKPENPVDRTGQRKPPARHRR